ncbi:methylosome subunit pICln [Bombyx mandarina]|uniref:Methylosome subunit pICln n=2 Tax=Bombyx TaxID=7090 RepID=A0A8R2AKJ5_BOMMO|nr:methylosome subunit pICln [Bombyx mori]XP_028027610.1 methylosome subunit pICln [Bombyx mandarina]
MVVVSSNFAEPADGVLLQSPSTKLLINDQELGTATLYITENNVIWGGGVSPSGNPAPTINLLYPSISLHAIQREPSPALYMVLNYELRLPELSQQAGSTDADDDDDFDVDDQPITQLRFIPENENELQAMYSAMCQGQELHPDPADEVEDDDPYMDGEEFDEGEEEFEDAEESAPDPAAALRRMRLGPPPGNGHDADLANK